MIQTGTDFQTGGVGGESYSFKAPFPKDLPEPPKMIQTGTDFQTGGVGGESYSFKTPFPEDLPEPPSTSLPDVLCTLIADFACTTDPQELFLQERMNYLLTARRLAGAYEYSGFEPTAGALRIDFEPSPEAQEWVEMMGEDYDPEDDWSNEAKIHIVMNTQTLHQEGLRRFVEEIDSCAHQGQEAWSAHERDIPQGRSLQRTIEWLANYAMYIMSQMPIANAQFKISDECRTPLPYSRQGAIAALAEWTMTKRKTSRQTKITSFFKKK